MTAVAPQGPSGAQSAPALTPKTMLRTLLDERRAAGRRMSVDEAVAIIVPLCMDLKERHGRGERVYVHPSCIAPGPDGLARVSAELVAPPENPYDRACLAPELKTSGQPGDARASVFSVGAILYEMLTGHHVGPGMARVKEIDPSYPASVDVLLAKALVGDPAHRPDDVGALASAMYHLAPAKSIHPPEISETKLDQSAEFEVDVRLSLIPPPVAMPVPVIEAPRQSDPARPSDNGARQTDPTAHLAELKLRLESDPRHRYVVHKNRMDHGPFTGVELLQQLASHTFVADDLLRDELSGQAQLVKEWEEFAPFAEQAGMRREAIAEKKAVQRAEHAEKQAGIAKYVIGASVVIALGIIAAVWFFTVRGQRKDDVSVADDPTLGGYEVKGGIKGQKRPPPPGQGGGGGGGGGGAYVGGMSYEQALSTNGQTVTVGKDSVGGLTDGQIAGPMRSAAFVNGCGAPSNMQVTVRVAVKMGRAVGVSVYTQPPNPGVAGCIDRAVRGLSWPATPVMDSFTTRY